MKKSISLLLSLLMVITALTALPFSAFAGTAIDVTSEAELVAALNKTEVVDSINITADFTVCSDCTINFDPSHINYYSDTVVTVKEGVTVNIGTNGMLGSMWPSYEGDWETPPTPNGKFINDGKIIVSNGGMIDADFDTNNGEVIIKNGGEAVIANTNNGTVTVEDGGVYATTMGGKAVNKGSINVYSGAVIESRMGTTIVNETEGVINLYGKFKCGCFNFGSGDGLWFENKGTVNGNGDIILYPVAQLDSMDSLIEKMMTELGQTSRFENWDDVNIFKKVEVSDYEEFAAAISTQRTVAGEEVAGNMDTIIELCADITVPQGADIGGMVLVIVPDSISLTVSGGASLTCGMENDGAVLVQSGGKLATTMGGAIVNRNTLTVEDGAELKSQMGGEVINENGASLTLDGTFYCGCFGMNGNDVAWFNNSGSVSGNGGIVLYQADEKSAPVGDMATLTESVNQQISGGATTPSASAHTVHSYVLGFCTVCGAAEPVVPPTPVTPAKQANTLYAKGKTVKVKKAVVKKKNVAVKRSKAITVKNAKGTVTFKKSKGNKKITVAKNGKITVKKGLKKGTYKITIKVTAAGNAQYKSAVKTVTVKIVIK